MSIIPQKRSAEATETVKRSRKTESNSPENSDPIGDCIGEGIQYASDDEFDDVSGEFHVFSYSCDETDPDEVKKPDYCFRCKGTDHVPAFCPLAPGLAIFAADIANCQHERKHIEEYCTVCDKVTNHDAFYCPDRCFVCFKKPQSDGSLLCPDCV